VDSVPIRTKTARCCVGGALPAFFFFDDFVIAMLAGASSRGEYVSMQGPYADAAAIARITEGPPVGLSSKLEVPVAPHVPSADPVPQQPTIVELPVQTRFMAEWASLIIDITELPAEDPGASPVTSPVAIGFAEDRLATIPPPAPPPPSITVAGEDGAFATIVPPAPPPILGQSEVMWEGEAEDAGTAKYPDLKPQPPIIIDLADQEGAGSTSAVVIERGEIREVVIPAPQDGGGETDFIPSWPAADLRGRRRMDRADPDPYRRAQRAVAAAKTRDHTLAALVRHVCHIAATRAHGSSASRPTLDRRADARGPDAFMSLYCARLFERESFGLSTLWTDDRRQRTRAGGEEAAGAPRARTAVGLPAR
jgi:hypothetical protein